MPISKLADSALGGNSPTFAIFVAKADELPDAYARYVVNGIRERFDLQGTPVRLYLRQTDNRFAERE